MSRQPLQDLAQWIRDRRAPPFEWIVEHVDAGGTLAPSWGESGHAADMLILLWALEDENGPRFVRGVEAAVKACAVSDGIAEPILRALRAARSGRTDAESFRALMTGRAAAAGHLASKQEPYYELLYRAMRPIHPSWPARGLADFVRIAERSWNIDTASAIAAAVVSPTIEEVFARIGAAP